ncbi:MAG: AEC family transporter [Azovibrio sp.]|uniref:AEC family transporter n=1 Tax=Azovibrio sp. TaxID=1872673 RepID=UPI003C756DCC
MLIRLVSVLLPIFAIVSVGYLYARRCQPDMNATNNVNMDVFVPALVFYALAGKPFDLGSYAPLALGGLVVLLGSGLLAWPVARLLGYPSKIFIPPMIFNNSGNIGLPLAVLAWGEAALPAAIVLFMVGNILHFSLGARWLNPRARLLQLWRVPVVAATLLGLASNLGGIQLWDPLLTAIKMLGDISVPLMLFSLGVRLATTPLGEWKIGLIGALFRPVSGLLLAFAGAWALGISGREREILIVFGALPPAVLNFLFAERYQQEPDRVASIVLIGHLVTLFFLPLALYLAIN